MMAMQQALLAVINMFRRVDELRPAIKCGGINIGKFSSGFFVMDILRINEFVMNAVGEWSNHGSTS